MPILHWSWAVTNLTWPLGGAAALPTGPSEILVARRYLERGFVDVAMRLFIRNAELVTPVDWSHLVERLMEQNRIPDVVRVCELGHVPLPRERMLGLADAHLQRKDVDTAIRLYELAEADRDRWAQVLDVLVTLPDRERQALGIAERHLVGQPPVAVAPTRQIKAVK